MSYNNMGRFGDTQIREVNGAPAHVNDTEAHWIDNMGPLGQLATESVGAGTVNPKTGLKEYWIPQAIGLGLQIGGPLLSAHLNKGNTDLEDNMQPWTESMDKRRDLANNMMDPQSQWSMEGANKIRQAGKDNLAFTNMLGSRNKAMGGVQGYSGITEQQNEANMNKTGADSQNRIENFNRQNMMQGSDLLGMVGKGYQKFGEMKQNRDIANMPFDWGDAMGSFGAGIAGGFGSGGDISPSMFDSIWENSEFQDYMKEKV